MSRFKKLTPGERIRSVNADTHNLLMDMAREHEARRSLSQQGIDVGSGDVRIANVSGETLTKFSVVGKAEPIATPAVNVIEFQDKRGFDSAEPDPDEPFAILQETIADGVIGNALMAGVTQCWVEMADAADEFAKPLAGDYEKLESSTDGTSCRILWRDTLPAAARDEDATLHTETTAPGGSDGDDGDYWEDTVAELWYGPKAAGAWGAGNAFGTGVVWALVLLSSGGECCCPDIDTVGGMMEWVGHDDDAHTWMSPDCDVVATFDGVALGGYGWGDGGFPELWSGTGGGGAWGRLTITIPASTLVTVYLSSPGGQLTVNTAALGDFIILNNGTPNTGGTATGGLDAAFSGGDAESTGGGGSGGPTGDGSPGLDINAPLGGDGNGRGGDFKELIAEGGTNFTIPSVSGTVTVTVTDTSNLATGQAVYLACNITGDLKTALLFGTIAVIDGTDFDFTLTEITVRDDGTLGSGTTGDDVYRVIVFDDTLLDSDGHFPGGGAGTINTLTEPPAFIGMGGDAYLRITWGPSVTSLNGKVGAITLIGNDGITVTPDDNDVLNLGLAYVDGGTF